MTFLTIIAFLELLSQVAAQAGKSTATCTYAGWTSYEGNSPCQIWATLQAACDPDVSVGSLDTASNKNTQYPPPSGSSATPCQCNVVAYNLMAACSWCQPNVYSENWVSETQWKSGCKDYNSSGLPSQASSLSSQIPPWAFATNGGEVLSVLALNQRLSGMKGESWLASEASSIAKVGSTPTTTLNNRALTTDLFDTDFDPGTSFFTPTAFASRTSFFTGTRFSTPTLGGFSGTRYSYPTITGPFNGDDDFDPFPTVNLAKVVGIPVGIVLGFYVLLGGIVLAVFLTRQKHRKAWYGPTAQFYRNGGRMLAAGPPLLASDGGQHAPNPFTTPSPVPSPAPTQYDPYAHQVQGGQGHNQQYYTPFAAQPATYQTGNQ